MNQTVAVAVIISFIGLIPTASASVIQLEYFHTPRCLECEDAFPIISDLEGIYGESLNVRKNDVNTPEGWKRWKTYGFLEVPALQDCCQRAYQNQRENVRQPLHVCRVSQVDYPGPSSFSLLFHRWRIHMQLFWQNNLHGVRHFDDSVRRSIFGDVKTEHLVHSLPEK